MKTVVVLTLLIIESSFCFSQTDINYYDYWFNSMDEALANPEVVINVDLGSQDLKEIPIEMKAFENLQMLLLDSNFITEVPDWIRDFKSLWYVSIGYNNLERIPSSLTKMKQLEHLSLRNNKITKLASTPFCQKSLNFLDLANNQLSQVPKFSRKGVYLESFFLNNNNIEMEKKSFKNIKSFGELDLRSNEICTFNKKLFRILCNINNSPYVYLESNPFDDEDKEMINYILNAYFIRKTNEIRPLDHYLEIYW